MKVMYLALWDAEVSYLLGKMKMGTINGKVDLIKVLYHINLPQIGILSGHDEEKFFKLLDERLELCKEALMCRHHALIRNYIRYFTSTLAIWCNCKTRKRRKNR